MSFQKDESWTILSPIEESIKQKIETVGTPLKDWNIKINRGILTGYNEAFIISGKKRQEILDNCQSEDEEARTAELIRPILRGRDIKKYNYEFANIYLICTFPAMHYNIDDYPAIRDYLLTFDKRKLEQSGEKNIDGVQGNNSRKRTNNKWFEMQDSIGYWDDFNKQHIAWKAVGKNLAFAILEPGKYLSAPASMIVSKNNEWLLCFLQSKVGKYFFMNNSDTTGMGDIMLNIQSLVKFSVPIPNPQTENKIKQALASNNFGYIDQLVYKSYGFDSDEIGFIEN
ncbi:MAG TPA: TaqI-like C-terminal specificity domain-containing protein [Lactovum miscens]|uniref:TaqI-like C-terminal specificity domain-containing protein n=1 Tax=Lactovum miscens TaxID=190387 RepID=UPI002EDA4D8A